MSASTNSAGDVRQAVETFDELCTHVEHALGVKIPEYLRNILVYGGFGNRVTLRALEESDVSSLERLALRDGHPQRFLCWDIYSDTASPSRDFPIIPGHRKLLIAIAAYLRENPNIVETSHE